jgi:hypothetical protein
LPRSRDNADADPDLDAVSAKPNTTTNADSDTIFTGWADRSADTFANPVSTW